MTPAYHRILAHPDLGVIPDPEIAAAVGLPAFNVWTRRG